MSYYCVVWQSDFPCLITLRPEIRGSEVCVQVTGLHMGLRLMHYTAETSGRCLMWTSGWSMLVFLCFAEACVIQCSVWTCRSVGHNVFQDVVIECCVRLTDTSLHALSSCLEVHLWPWVGSVSDYISYIQIKSLVA